MNAKPLKKGATYDDLRDVPDHYVAEMFDSELYASPRPALPHAHASSVLGAVLSVEFHRLGAGGWVILDEPELHFGNDVLVPDLASLQRERLPTLHEGRVRVRVPPFDAIELELGSLWI